MPGGVIKGVDAENVWSRSVAVAKEQYPGLKSKDSDKFYAIVMTIYKNMCTKYSCTPKAESDISMISNRIELLEATGGLVLPSGSAGWQLLEPLSPDSRKKTGKVVRALNDGMRKAASELSRWMRGSDVDIKSREGMRQVGDKLGVVWAKYLKPVIGDVNYKSTGVSDAEPVYDAGQRLIEIVKRHYGLKGFTSLGDYIH